MRGLVPELFSSHSDAVLPSDIHVKSFRKTVIGKERQSRAGSGKPAAKSVSSDGQRYLAVVGRSANAGSLIYGR